MWPLHIYQITTWVIAIWETLYIFLEVFPYSETDFGFAINIVIFAIIAIPLTIFDAILIFSDPTDPVVYQERLLIQKMMQQNWDNLDKDIR